MNAIRVIHNLMVDSTAQKKRRGLLCVAVLFYAGVLNFAACAGETAYKGKPASFWLEDARASLGITNESIVAFKAMGSNAVPFLIEILQRKPSKLSEMDDNKLYNDRLMEHVPKGVVRALPSAMRTEERREAAAFLIGVIGPDASAAIPSLMVVLNDPNEDWRISEGVQTALMAMGEKLAGQVQQFIAYLQSDDRETRRLGATLLASTGPKAKAAVPALLALATNKNESLSVARALWNIDRRTNAALGVYTHSLQSTNEAARQLGLIYLGEMETAARAAGPDVQKLLTDPDSGVREHAEMTLDKIDPELLLQSRQDMTREIPQAVANFIEAIHSEDIRKRFRWLDVIGLTGPEGKLAVPALIEVLTGPGPPVPSAFAGASLMSSRREAADALGEIGPEARAAVPALVDLLARKGDGNGAVYCRSLGGIGPDARQALPALEEAMRSGNPGVRLAAATAVARIAPAEGSNAVVVLKSLQSNQYLKWFASVPLWRLGIEPEPPVKAIIEELNGRSSSDEISLVRALGEIGPEAKPALPTLKKFLQPRCFIRLRRESAIAFRKIDPQEAAKLGLPGVLLVP